MADRKIEELDEDQCLALIAPGGVGRIAYASRFGLAVLPVNYALQDGAIVFRTAENGPLDEDLRTGIANADYRVAFEIDSIDLAGRKAGACSSRDRPITSLVQDRTRSGARASNPGLPETGSCSSGSPRTGSPAAAWGQPDAPGGYRSSGRDRAGERSSPDPGGSR